MFNAVKRISKAAKSIPRHIRWRETPQSLLLAMKVYIKTGKESLVDMLAERVLSISYDRLRTFSIDIANSVIEHWNKEGVVVPPQAVKGVFTTGNTDNVD